MKHNNENLYTTAAEVENEKSFKDVLCAVGGFFKKIGLFFAGLFKSDKIKNENLFRRGGYSLVITAVVLVGVIVLNVLVSALADRFNLEFDMTSDKKNSISEENIDYIKNLDADVTVTICGTKEDYSSYMSYYAQNYYSVTISSNSDLEYFEQTITLVDKYNDYNDRIVIKYVDPQSTEFTAITSTYSSYSLNYGDMIVTSSAGGKERVKVLTFSDIYATTEDTTYSYYGYSSSTLSANRLETALTSAIAYVTSADSKKVAVLSGHSSNSYTDAYKELLTSNNYDITDISDSIITEISSDYDAIIISAPTIDFVDTEIEIIADFLENGGNMGKGLIFFADATCPALPNFYSFLQQWGISVSEGLVLETYSSNHISGDPSTMVVYPAELEDDDITSNLTYAISGYVVPMQVCEPATTERTATALMQTLETTVAAPVGSSSDWADYTDDDKMQFDCVIQSVESDYDSENNHLTSYVMAFSSVEFVQSTWASYSDLCNQDIVMACTDRAAHVGDNSIIFTAKVITDQSFASSVTETNTKIITVVFMFAIPILVIAAGIIVFIRRRNAR